MEVRDRLGEAGCPGRVCGCSVGVGVGPCAVGASGQWAVRVWAWAWAAWLGAGPAGARPGDAARCAMMRDAE
jgi:hypothetical protein